MLKKILLILILLLLAGFIYFRMVLYPQFPVANGYAAKKMCACTFISDRQQASIQAEDLGLSPLDMTKTVIDHEQKSATSSIFGLGSRTAVFRNDAGCILLDGKDDHQIDLKITRPQIDPQAKWPLGNQTQYDSLPLEVNTTKLNAAIKNAFDPEFAMTTKKTRAVVVSYRGQIIGEQYAQGYNEETELLGWSMAKSITSTLIGILIKEGHFNLDDNHLFPEWTDERKNITLRQLLHMESGLAFSEEYASISDATQMLFTSENSIDIPLNNPLAHKPGTHWSYSSGTTNLLFELIRNHLKDKPAYLAYPYKELFNKIGMNSSVSKTAESGRFIGSSYLYASPKDWAKFGYLYLKEGNWNGAQIVDTSWVDFVRTPSPNSNGGYGGQFWLNVDHAAYKNLPEDMYSCNGHDGQFVYIFPSHDLIVVRMGLSGMPNYNVATLLEEVMESIDFPAQ